MMKVLSTLLVFAVIACQPLFASLPPTTTKGSGDANPVLTFRIDTPNIPITHSANTATLGTIPVAGGGIGITSGTSGGVLGFTGSTTLASSSALTANQLIVGGGAGATPSTLAAGSQYQVLRMGAANPAYGSINLDQSAAVTGVLPNANTTGTSAATASTLVLRDSDGNAKAVNWVSGATNVVSATGTTTLTSASTRLQQLTGTAIQTFKLPDATTLSVGATFEFNNNSTGVLTVVDNASGGVGTVVAGGYMRVVAIAVSTSAGSWDKHYLLPSNASYGTAGLSITGTLTTTGTAQIGSLTTAGPVKTDASGNLTSEAQLGLARGGTNADLSATGGTSRVLKQTSTGAAITVAQLACSDLSGVATSCSTDATNASNISSGTLAVARGGTGLGSGTSGGILGFTASGTLASSGALTASALLLGGGAGATPTAMGSLGTTTTVLHGNAAGAPTFGAVGLTADVTGVLPTANGGTGANIKFVWVRVSGSNCGSSPCTLTDSNGVTSVTRASSGDYTVNFSASFSTAPSCQVMCWDGVNNQQQPAVSTPTTSAFEFQCRIDTTGTNTDSKLMVNCQGI